MKIRKKKYLEGNVYEKSIERIEYLFKNFDKVVVSFSGGKDSTAVLNLALEVAKRNNKLPLEVVFFDEEAIHPPTIEYVERIKNLKDINLKWFCLEFKHRNACSNEEPYWFTWDKDKKDLWVRELPQEAITHHKNFKKGMSFQEFSPSLFDKEEGRIAMLTGIRTQESLRRYQVIARKKNDSYINERSEKASNQYRCFPIYDWSSEDIWLATKNKEWDYNKTYDIFNQTKLFNDFLHQRVCPPYGEEPLRGLWVYAECFPEMWEKMIYRVKGVATAWRYANTELYSTTTKKPDNVSWKEFIKIIIDSYDSEYQSTIKKNINSYIAMHKKKSKKPILEEETNLVSGFSWKALCGIAIKGDFKGRQITKFNLLAQKERDKNKITLEEAIKNENR